MLAARLKTRRVLTQMIRVSATTEPRGSTSERTTESITAKTKASPATNHATLTTASTLVSPPSRGACAAGASGRLAVAWRRGVGGDHPHRRPQALQEAGTLPRAQRR